MSQVNENSGKRVRNGFEDFIRAWEGSDTVQEAADKLGITKDSAGQRASHYRTKLGIDLKTMQRGQRLEVGVAQDFLAQLRAEQAVKDAAELCKIGEAEQREAEQLESDAADEANAEAEAETEV